MVPSSVPGKDWESQMTPKLHLGLLDKMKNVPIGQSTENKSDSQPFFVQSALEQIVTAAPWANMDIKVWFVFSVTRLFWLIIQEDQEAYSGDV